MLANKIDLPQGSEQWLTSRKGKISASKVASILNVSPYKTALELYEEEMGLRDPKEHHRNSDFLEKYVLEPSLKLEDQVREWFHQTYGIKVEPCVIQSKENPMFMASLDGMSEDGKVIVEIKNNNKNSHEMARQGMLPAQYTAQVHFQMYVAGLDLCHYISHRQGENILVVVHRDKQIIDDMLPVIYDFKRRLDEFDPPPLSDRDYEDMGNDADLKYLISEYEMWRLRELEAEIQKNKYKKTILENIGDKNAKGTNWKVTRYGIKGRVDYDAMIQEELPSVDLEKYRKSESVSYRITVN